MAEQQSGFYKLLRSPLIYNGFRRVLQLDKVHNRMIRQYVSPQPGERVLDIGCGAGEMAVHLKNNPYIGIDSSSEYISHANKHFSDSSHVFLKRDVNELVDSLEFGQFQIILAFGLLHHLSDKESQHLFSAVKKLLLPGGRFITVDPCLFKGQNPITRLIIKNDRGKNVRYRGDYLKLAKEEFSNSEAIHDKAFFPFPFSCEIVRCINLPKDIH